MKRVPLLLALILTLSFGNAFAGMSLDNEDFTYNVDTIGVGMPVSFDLRFTELEGAPLPGGTNGFQVYSPDGAQWTPIAYTAVVDMSVYWTLVFSINPFSITGEGADTVGFGGSKMTGLGVPANFDEVTYNISTSVTDEAYDGLTLCLDTAFYPPSGLWKWAYGGTIGAVFPSWSGPHCYTIYKIPNLPPVFTTPLVSFSGDHCAVATVPFAATDFEDDPLTFSLVAGIGAVTPAGVWSYAPSLGDVGASLSATIGVNDGFNATVTHVMNVNFTNVAPAFVTGCGTAVPVGMGNTASITVTGNKVDCDPFSFALGTITPTPVGTISIAGGVVTFATATGASPAGDGGLIYDVEVIITDGVDQNTCMVHFDVLTTEPYEVQLEKTHNVIQGTHNLVDVTVTKGSEQMGGFDILIAYDASALIFQTALEGDIYNCGWEYFNYRYGANGNCGNACPSGLLRVVGIAETNNGAVHPDFACVSALVDPTLFTLDFLVTDDRTFECMYIPIRFFWMDCGDNSIAYSPTDNPLSVVQGVSRYVIDFDLVGHIEDMTTGFPTYTGVQEGCFDNDDGKPVPIQFVDFVNGGIDIICADSIDARGDINLNGTGNEIADAVLFSNYFVYGLSVFNVNVAGQIAATDVNADGLTLSVADLVYIIRVIVGDALPYAKLGTVSANLIDYNGTLSIDQEMGAAFIRARGNVTPTLLADNMDMNYAYDAANNETRILISSQTESFSGEFLAVENVISTEFATYYGAQVVTSNMPATFALNQNYPNPFNPTTNVTFYVPVSSDYSLTIYNVAGQKVTEMSGTAQVGENTVLWNADGQASGVYFYQLKTDNFTDTKKMVLMK
jgi:hypothetical protein